MINGHSHLDISLKWNNLKAKGGEAVAEGLKQNQVLNKIDLGWNGMGDVGMVAVSEMLKSNAALTHLDVSHNRINPQGCMALAEGIQENHNLLSLEVNFNPMAAATAGKLAHDATGITPALIEALRTSENIERVGQRAERSCAVAPHALIRRTRTATTLWRWTSHGTVSSPRPCTTAWLWRRAKAGSTCGVMGTPLTSPPKAGRCR